MNFHLLFFVSLSSCKKVSSGIIDKAASKHRKPIINEDVSVGLDKIAENEFILQDSSDATNKISKGQVKHKKANKSHNSNKDIPVNIDEFSKIDNIHDIFDDDDDDRRNKGSEEHEIERKLDEDESNNAHKVDIIDTKATKDYSDGKRPIISSMKSDGFFLFKKRFANITLSSSKKRKEIYCKIDDLIRKADEVDYSTFSCVLPNSFIHQKSILLVSYDLMHWSFPTLVDTYPDMFMLSIIFCCLVFFLLGVLSIIKPKCSKHRPLSFKPASFLPLSAKDIPEFQFLVDPVDDRPTSSQ